jgi:hypothetical protein
MREKISFLTHRYGAILCHKVKIFLLLTTSLFLIASCEGGYGQLQDHSELFSARIAEESRVLFSFHRFAYRTATGWRAFPDGGIPDYATDVSFLGVYDLQTLKHQLLLREKNTNWQPGSGLFFIHSVNGSKSLITQGGQLRGPFKLAVKHMMFDTNSAEAVTLNLKSELNERGRDPGCIYLVDSDGTLVFVTLSTTQAQDPGAYRNTALVPEIWVRTPGGNYVKAASSAQYDNTLNGEVIYWEPSTCEFMAISIAKEKTRREPGYKKPVYQNPQQAAILSSDRKAIEISLNLNGQSSYQRLDLRTDLKVGPNTSERSKERLSSTQ